MLPPHEPKPPVWSWYVAYCVTLAAMYLGCIVLGVGLLVAGAAETGPDAAEMTIVGAIMAVLCVPFLAASAAAPFLPRTPWAWTFHVVLVALGMTSACCLPACIPMLIQFLKPETKAWFGKR